MLSAQKIFERRRARNRTSLRKVANGKPRLSIHRSSKHIYAQIIDDNAGTTLAAASTLEGDFKKAGKTGADIAAASTIGKLVAERAVKAGVKTVVFDRGGFLFHGRVKALAEAAREAGLKF
jgi:large subunit ribosomal protein L18